MPRLLIVEDSKILHRVLKHTFEARGEFVASAYTLEQTRTALDEPGEPFFAAVVDLHLPDAPNGEAVDLVRGRDVPVVVFTGETDQAVRNEIWQKGVVDYVYKDNHKSSIDHLVSTLERLKSNPDFRVLVVDDSTTRRRYIVHLLERHRFRVLTAENGQQGLDIVASDPSIRLVVTDYNMPVMDGFTLVKRLREFKRKDELAVVGVSAENDPNLCARFIKNGANDFLESNFTLEEFYCRIDHHVDMQRALDQIREAARRDWLTGLCNRRYFWESAKALLTFAEASGRTSLIAVVDIDHFKRVNDEFGHESGDCVLRAVAQRLKRRFETPTSIAARFGGEEFVVLWTGADDGLCTRELEAFRLELATEPLPACGRPVPITVSIGLSKLRASDLDAAVGRADAALYQAKSAGRNRLVRADD